MTIETDHAADEYVRHIYDVVNGVQELREIREQAFNQSEPWGRELTRLLSDQGNVPKRPLFAIFQAAGILESEAAGMEGSQQKRVLEIVDAIRLTFRHILTGQSGVEYALPKPGVPRVR
jgi:hypothetical protein